MLSGRCSLLLALCSLLVLSGCGSSSYGTSSGTDVTSSTGSSGGKGNPSGNPIGTSGPTGTDNTVVATPSVGGTVSVISGSTRTVAIAFTSSDGRMISGFGISGSLGNLPAGWSGPSTFACAQVSTGSGCVLNLTYAPTAVASGTVVLNYVFVDNATVPKTGGALSIAYVATPQNNVVAAASPTGQINAVIAGGSQAVSVNFTTDDGNVATNVVLTTDLSTLPSGWSTAATNFSCATVSTGSGCQLNLTYAPTVAGQGTLTLNYAYVDDGGAAKTGALNIAYAGTTNDSVVAAASPSGQINAVVGAGTQPVAVTFTTDDGLPASTLALTSSLLSLPAGWSSTSTAFTCANVATGTGCQLSLVYAPGSAGSGTLTLTYSYLNDSGTPKTGSLDIAYRATTSDNVVWTPSISSLGVFTGSSTDVTVTFTTDDGNPATGLSVTSDLGALPSGWSSTSGSFSCASVSTGMGCQLALTYAPAAVASGTLTLSYGYSDDSGTAKTGTVSIPYTATTQPHLYIAQLAGPLYYCALNSDGTLSSCAATGNGFSAPTGFVFYGSNFAYVTDYYNNAVYLCSVGSDGSLSGCSSTGSNFQYPWQLAISGTTLYATNAYFTGGVTTCAIAVDGSLSGCTESAGSGTAGIAASAGFAYVGAGSSSVDVCAIDAISGALSGCTGTGSGFSGLDGITLSGGYAYVANQGDGTVSVCTVNTGSLSGCANSSIGGGPTSVAILGNQAYVNDVYGNIYLCAVGSGGALTGCAESNGGTSFSLGIQIAIH